MYLNAAHASCEVTALPWIQPTYCLWRRERSTAWIALSPVASIRRYELRADLYVIMVLLLYCSGRLPFSASYPVMTLTHIGSFQFLLPGSAVFITIPLPVPSVIPIHSHYQSFLCQYLISPIAVFMDIMKQITSKLTMNRCLLVSKTTEIQ